MAKRFLVLIALLMLGFYIAGCAEGDNSDSVVNPNPNVFAPTGSISGVVFDICTQAPVKGAVISVAYLGKVHQVTTAANGAFSFNGVPAIEENGYDVSWEEENLGGYAVTCDLTKVTGYGYALINEVEVVYSDLNDGNNDDLYSGVTEGGSGASTPVDKLAATTEFDVSALTSTISGTVFDITSGRVATAATVTLLFDGRVLANNPPQPTVAGVFSFPNVPASDGEDYTLVVSKGGFDYAVEDVAEVGLVPVGKKITGLDPNACGFIAIDCPVPCNADLLGIEVDLVANAAKDITVPYILSVAAGGESDIIDGDSFETLHNTDITSIVFTFDEDMKANRTLDNAVDLTTSFTVVVTSAGPFPSGHTLVTAQRSGVSIIDDFEVIISSSGLTNMIVTPTPSDDDTIIARANAVLALGFALTNATVVIGAGDYTVELTENSPHLTDASLVPWSIGTPGELDSNGFFHAFDEAYQDNFILDGDSITFTVEAQ